MFQFNSTSVFLSFLCPGTDDVIKQCQEKPWLKRKIKLRENCRCFVLKRSLCLQSEANSCCRLIIFFLCPCFHVFEAKLFPVLFLVVFLWAPHRSVAAVNTHLKVCSKTPALALTCLQVPLWKISDRCLNMVFLPRGHKHWLRGLGSSIGNVKNVKCLSVWRTFTALPLFLLLLEIFRLWFTHIALCPDG